MHGASIDAQPGTRRVCPPTRPITTQPIMAAPGYMQNIRQAADPKIEGEWAGGSTRRSAAEPGPGRVDGAGSGGGFEGDLVAQGLQLADVVVFGALGVDVGVVEAGAQVVVAQVGVGQQVPDDDQDGAAHRHDGLLGAAVASDAPVALP